MTAPSEDNPFVIEPRQRRHVRPWLRAVVILVVCLGGVYAMHSVAQRWLVSRLAHNLSQHPPHVQIERLGMLAQFGGEGLPHIVSALASPDDAVSAAAFGILSDMQGRWQTSHRGEAVRMNRTLVDALQRIIADSPAPGRHRVAELLNQTIVDTVDAEDEETAGTYRLACSLLAEITGTETTGPEAVARRHATRPAVSLAADEGSAAARTEPIVQLEPLPINPSVRLVPGTYEGLQDIDGDTASRSPSDPSSPESEAVAVADEDGANTSATRLPPSLVQIHRGSLTVTPVHAEAPLGDQPLAAYETRSVIDFLGSLRAPLNQAADRELRKRGFNEGDMELAVRLISTDVRVRLAMVEELPGRSDVDPRQWLIWLAADAERDVRLQAISRLGTMDDPEVRAALRKRLQEERDPTIATRIRRFLGLR